MLVRLREQSLVVVYGWGQQRIMGVRLQMGLLWRAVPFVAPSSLNQGE